MKEINGAVAAVGCYQHGLGAEMCSLCADCWSPWIVCLEQEGRLRAACRAHDSLIRSYSFLYALSLTFFPHPLT